MSLAGRSNGDGERRYPEPPESHVVVVGDRFTSLHPEDNASEAWIESDYIVEF